MTLAMKAKNSAIAKPTRVSLLNGLITVSTYACSPVDESIDISNIVSDQFPKHEKKAQLQLVTPPEEEAIPEVHKEVFAAENAEVSSKEDTFFNHKDELDSASFKEETNDERNKETINQENEEKLKDEVSKQREVSLSAPQKVSEEEKKEKIDQQIVGQAASIANIPITEKITEIKHFQIEPNKDEPKVQLVTRNNNHQTKERLELKDLSRFDLRKLPSYREKIKEKFVKIFNKKNLILKNVPIENVKSNHPSSGVDESYFFKATDDKLLYNLGSSYYKDYKSGIRKFAFAHVNSPDAQKRSILGIASYLKYFEDNKVLIITSKIDNCFFSPFKKQSKKREMIFDGDENFKYSIYECFSVNLLEIDEIIERLAKINVQKHPKIFKKLIKDFDAVLFDLPPLDERKNKYSVYLPILQEIENVTFTLKLKTSKFSDVKELNNYFSSYNIKIKGSVVESNRSNPRNLLR